jgi:hypothetical protein
MVIRQSLDEGPETNSLNNALQNDPVSRIVSLRCRILYPQVALPQSPRVSFLMPDVVFPTPKAWAVLSAELTNY